MTTRQPLQPLSPPPAHAVKSRYAHLQRPTSASTSRSNGRDTMQQRDGDFEDLHDAASVVSGLSSLENDAEDEFDRLMIRNERDQRRLSQAAGGKPQPFSKARAHPRVGLTLENLERNNAEAGRSTNANVQLESPPSSSGSVKNDPSIHAPASWGRKSRSNRNWMRAITRDEGQQTPVPDDDAPNGHYNNVGVPHRSVEDSPLSHKTSMHGTPRPATPDEWDLTFELNEASMIASTPYIPRSTVLDDIRQREMEAANEQAKDAARAARTRGSSPDQISRRSSFTRTAENAKSAPKLAPAMHDSPPSQKKLRSRTQSWQNMSKSQPVLGVTKERMPAAMYKSTESIATVDREVIATVEKGQPKRVPHRRQDSQDLLRRLARASNTPSPARPQATPPGPLDGASETATVRTVSSRQEATLDGGESASVPSADSKPVAPVPDAGTEQKTQNEAEQVPEPSTETEAKGGDATPVPAQRTLNPKTPVVTGAWVDTPGPRTAQRSTSTSTERDRSRSQSQPRSSRKSSMSRDKSPERPKSSREGTAANAPIEPIRPQLPRSALQALVEEAKAHRKESSTDFGDSTLNSLEELITPLTEIAMDDTLQGLQVPTDAPRNDAERQRQQELVHLHRMNDRLRAARTSIRDASRGMKRVEDQVEHVEEGENGEKIKVMTSTCICSSGDHVQNFSMWKWWKSLFWEQRLKTLRQKSNSRWRVWGGLTGLSIFLIFFLAWLVSEEIACEMYCRPLYAYSYPYPFSVNPNAPKYPYVIPTLVYRTFIRDWWVPISSFFSWMGVTLWACIFGQEHGINYAGGRSMRSAGVGESHWVSGDAKIMEERAWDASMFNDEILPGRR